MIEVKQADGSVKEVPAPVSMYTEVRYEWGRSTGPRWQTLCFVQSAREITPLRLEPA